MSTHSSFYIIVRPCPFVRFLHSSTCFCYFHNKTQMSRYLQSKFAQVFSRWPHYCFHWVTLVEMLYLLTLLDYSLGRRILQRICSYSFDIQKIHYLISSSLFCLLRVYLK